MVSQRVTKVLEETKRLTLEERRQLLTLLNAGEARGPLGDAELDALLIQKGLMSASPATATAEDIASAEAWKPVAIQGKPLSETIIEERR
jgi:hypothetical protein